MYSLTCWAQLSLYLDFAQLRDNVRRTTMCYAFNATDALEHARGLREAQASRNMSSFSSNCKIQEIRFLAVNATTDILIHTRCVWKLAKWMVLSEISQIENQINRQNEHIVEKVSRLNVFKMTETGRNMSVLLQKSPKDQC